MAETKNRALLIACPSDNLAGPINDVEAMSDVLQKISKPTPWDITKLCGSNATREKILESWKTIIKESTENDAVVIYYSGHGGLVKRPDSCNESEPSRFQFLVPFGFNSSPSSTNDTKSPENDTKSPENDTKSSENDTKSSENDTKSSENDTKSSENDTKSSENDTKSSENDTKSSENDKWTGILDSEISKLLMDTAQKTKNVTYILDCCYSAGVGRGPNGLEEAKLKQTDVTADYKDIAKHASNLRVGGALWDLSKHVNSYNPDVVRISACSTNEPAWEYRNSDNLAIGLFTDKLKYVLLGHSSYSSASSLPESKLSWRNIMLEVASLVECASRGDSGIPPQRPRVEGADTRIPFSTKENIQKALFAESRNNEIIIGGGKSHGVNPDDIFELTPLGAEQKALDSKAKISTIGVKEAYGFHSTAPIPEGFTPLRALAVLKSRSKKWPITLLMKAEDPDRTQLRELLEATGNFELSVKGASLILYVDQTHKFFLFADTMLISERQWADQRDVNHILSFAQEYAQGQDLLSLTGGDYFEGEGFDPDIYIEIGVIVDAKKKKRYPCDEKESKKSSEKFEIGFGEGYYVFLKHRGKVDVWVNVLRVDARGRVVVITSALKAGGFPITRETRALMIDTNEDDKPGTGLRLSRPTLPGHHTHVDESFIFVLSEHEVDLRHLESSLEQPNVENTINGLRKGDGEKAMNINRTRYNVVRVNYSLNLGTTPDLSRSVGQVQNTRYSPEDTSVRNTGKGNSQSLFREEKIDRNITVINLHSEKIRVTLQAFLRRKLTAGGINIGMPGGGLNIATEVDEKKPFSKQLGPWIEDPNGATGIFKIPHDYGKFMLVSIFLDGQKDAYIENDILPVGAAVLFEKKPNLKIILNSR